MSRRAFSLAALPAALVLGLGLSACGGGYKTKTLHFTEKDTNENGFNDAPPKAKLGKQGPDNLSPGDVITFRSNLLDAAKKPVGDINAECITTHGGTFRTVKAHCDGTATVPGGQLVVSVGGPLGSSTTHGAIIGGTGDYAGAGGTFTSVDTPSPTHDTFNIQIPKK